MFYNFFLPLGIFCILIFLVFFFAGIATRDKKPKIVNDIIDAAFDPDVEDMIESIRQGVYGSGELPDSDAELAQLAYGFLTEWAMRGEG